MVFSAKPLFGGSTEESLSPVDNVAGARGTRTVIGIHRVQVVLPELQLDRPVG